MNPPQNKPTDTAKYDRQLRLWGEEGQAYLEGAHVCLLNGSATGTETLKNLVLPGIGQFTVVDGKKVDEADFNNFFIEEGSQGKSRATVTKDLLKELNDRVEGHAVERDPVEVINTNLDFFKQYTLVIANNVAEESLLKLASYCWDNRIPLCVVRTWGFVGYLRVVVPEHTVIESKPDNPADDLRLANPFKELAEYAEQIQMEGMNSTEHSHVPFVIILLQYMAKWKAEHDGKPPQTYAEKSAFKDLVIRGSRKSDEENFAEAHKSAHKSFAPAKIPSGTAQVLDDSQTLNITENSSPFWLLAAALRAFVHNEGEGTVLPLMGSIPDMHSTTDGYIAIQKIYQEKAQRDLQAVTAHLHAILSKIGKPADYISADEIKKFCKNSLFLQVVRYRSLADETNPATAKGSFISAELADKDSNLVWYVLLRAAERFRNKHQRYPGEIDAHVAEDVEGLKSAVTEFLHSLNLNDVSVEDKYVQEMVRFGGAELHPIAALMGGVASQEVIKLLTHQYTPVDNTFIFNGLRSTSSSVSL